MSAAATLLAPSAAAAPARPRVDIAAVQRRTLFTLSVAQVIGGVGLGAGVTVAGLLATELTGTNAVAGLPLAASVAGTAAAAVPLARLMRRAGRRAGLRLGWLLGLAGSLAVIAAAALGSLALLLAGMLLVGCGQAASDAARYAAADLAPQRSRATAIGIVVFATAISTVASPNLAGPSASVAGGLGLPTLVGPFLLAAVGFTLAAVVLTAALRPDPLLVAAELHSRGDAPVNRLRMAELLRRPGAATAVWAMVGANFVMVFLMTMTPIHLSAHGPALGAVGLAVSLHLGGMYAPSPLTGRLADRVGRRPVIGLGGVVLVVAGLLAVTAEPHQVGLVVAAAGLLGVGWNFAFISASTLLTEVTAEADRPRMQGTTDALGGIAGMLGGAVSGVVLAVAGYAALGAITAAVGAGLLLVCRPRRRPVDVQVTPQPAS